MRMSRRILLRALGLSGAAAATGAVAASPEAEIVVPGSVAWCHYQRGLLMFRPAQGSTDYLVRLEPREGIEDTLRSHARPGRPLDLRVTWRPDLDVLSPWQALQVTFPDGERAAARRPNA